MRTEYPKFRLNASTNLRCGEKGENGKKQDLLHGGKVKEKGCEENLHYGGTIDETRTKARSCSTAEKERKKEHKALCRK